MIYKVSGTSFHQDAIALVAVGNRVHLVPQPDNEHDANAIQVQSEAKEVLGWIPSYAHLNEQLKQTYTDEEIRALEVEITAVIGQRFDKLGLRIKVNND